MALERVRVGVLVRRVLLTCVVCCVGLAVVCGGVWGAVRHEYLGGLSDALSAGVPPGSKAGGEEAVTGALSGVNAISLDSGKVWVAEKMEGLSATRVDAFDASSGAFVTQFPQPAGLVVLDHGIAVGHGTGSPLVFVGGADLESGQGRVAVFDGSGGLLGAWSAAGVLAGGFGEVHDVAADNSGKEWASGDVYVTGSSEAVVDVFKGEAKEGLVAQLTGTCETPSSSEVCAESVPFSAPSQLAVDPVSGEFAVLDGEIVDLFLPSGVAGQFKFIGRITATPRGPLSGVTGLALDEGRVYVAEGTNLFVDEFSAAGKYEGALSGISTGLFNGPHSVAVESGSHRVFVGDYEGQGNVMLGSSLNHHDIVH